MQTIEGILSQYNISPSAIVQPFGSGLINSTWKIKEAGEAYILQKINSDIFKHPQHIADNIETIGNHLSQHHPHYFFVKPIAALNGKTMLYAADKGYYRLFPFVKNSHTNNIAETAQQAFEAAQQFGRFTKALSSMPAHKLKTTLPEFHNLSMRYNQFQQACSTGNSLRVAEAQGEIQFLHRQNHIVSTFEKITTSPVFKLRVTHHDTKISNVLFDPHNKGICVIDLDTVMPGFFISDVGDMMRTYLSPVSEEEKDFAKIEIRDEYFKAILEGYLHEMADELTSEEADHFVYAGLFMIYMQAVRFLTDHLNNDSYYGAVYDGQNLVRAKNQITLLKRLINKASQLV